MARRLPFDGHSPMPSAMKRILTNVCLAMTLAVAISGCSNQAQTASAESAGTLHKDSAAGLVIPPTAYKSGAGAASPMTLAITVAADPAVPQSAPAANG